MSFSNTGSSEQIQLAQNIHMDPISEILEELRRGRMIVLVDDEKRENEGDLVCAAEHVTAETINFMLTEARGMLCVPLAGQTCDRLELEPQSRIHTAPHGTAFLVTVDAHERFGVTTGVSAADRAKTVAMLAGEATQPSDLTRPGHLQPLRAREGGTLVRAGQTEGAIDMCRLAGLRPAAAIIEIMNEDGTMARRPQLEKLCALHQLKMCTVADVVQYRLQREKLVRRIGDIPFKTDAGPFRLVAYQSVVDPLPHVALVCGEVGQLTSAGLPIEIDESVYVRMHRQNLLSDVFGDLSQPTCQTIHSALSRIQVSGHGALVYLRHERMGTGLLQRLQTVTLNPHEPETAKRPAIDQGQQTSGVMPPADKGAYGIGAQILRDLGIRKLRLITDHPFTPTALGGFGLEITEFVPVKFN